VDSMKDVPASSLEAKGESLLGCLAARASITGDIVQPAVPVTAWGIVGEWDELQGVRLNDP